MNGRQYLHKIFKVPQNCVLTLHRKPDGDSIGSNLAMAHALEELGHTVTIYSKDVIPDAFKFIKNIEKIHILPPSEIKWSEFEQYISLDISTPEMMGETIEFPKSLNILVIDHHATNSGWGSYNIVDSLHISTASLLYELFLESDIKIDKKIAQCLLTGLATDSGFFTYINSSKPLKVAADLFEKGADYQEIVFNLQNQTHIEDLVFLSKSLENIRIIKNAVILPVTNNVWTTYGVSVDKNYLLTNYVRSIKGTDFGVVILEEKPSSFRLELRSRIPGFNVAEIAQRFGGGGHIAAAGARVENSTLEEIINKIVL